jgi:hypothetical protein
MPYRFTTDDIRKIALRLGLQKVNEKKWNGTDINGAFLQTYIHDHGNGIIILTGTAKQIANQLGFRDLADIYDFLCNKKRSR